MSDLRSDVESAIQSLSEREETPTPAPEAPSTPSEATPSAPEMASEEAPQGSQERPRDERGRFAKDTAPPLPEKVPVGAQPPKMAPQAAPAEAAKPSETFRPPQSWKPTVRELFGKLPVEVQQEVIRRERESERILQESASARNGYQRFQEILSPYESVLRAQGEPMQVLGGLLQTAAVLAGAPAPMKAQALARVIQAYGVDVNLLADALQGQPMPVQGQPQQWQPQEFRDPRVDQLLAQREQVLSRKAEEGIREVQHEEFFEDLRDLMADILDGAAARGVAMSAREAYNRAIWADPEVSKIMTQRREAAQVGTAAATQRAQIAASSVQGRPTVSVGKTQPGASLRDDIMNAIDKLQEE